MNTNKTEYEYTCQDTIKDVKQKIEPQGETFESAIVVGDFISCYQNEEIN